MHLAELVRRHAVRRGDRTALVDDRGTLSFAELSEQVESLAAGLESDLSVARGDRVAVGCLNRTELLVLLLACARLGVVCVPLNWRLAPAELAYQLDNVSPRLVIVDDLVAGTLAQVDDDRWTLLRLGADDPGELAPLLSGDGAATQHGEVGDDVLVVHTSGTTGRPKGAVLTQEGLLAHGVNAGAMIELTPDDVHLGAAPLFHVGGLNIATLPTLLAGGTVVLHDRFDPARWLEDVERHRPDHSILVPPMAAAVEAQPGFDDADLGSLRVVVTGSTIVPGALIQRWFARGVPMVQTYGSTETAPVATHQTRDDALAHPDSSGLPAERCEVRVVAPDGTPALPGEEGAIQVRGQSLFRGYWDDPEATAEVLDADGWFTTGDIGTLDAAGRLTVHDRRSNLIVSGGENIYPAELELALASHPGVAELAVVGRADERWGHVPVVVVVPSGDDLTLDDVLAHLDGRLARYKLPKDVVNVAELPRNALGKVVRPDVAALLG